MKKLIVIAIMTAAIAGCAKMEPLPAANPQAIEGRSVDCSNIAPFPRIIEIREVLKALDGELKDQLERYAVKVARSRSDMVKACAEPSFGVIASVIV